MPKAATTDLSALSIEGLKELQQRIAAELQEREKQAKRDAFEKIKEAAAAVRMDPHELLAEFGMGSQRKTVTARKKGVVKYANPADPTQTWTGRGRRPAWVEEHLRKKGALEDLLIK